MKKFIALLRGINVSGHRLIRMEDLRELFSEMGFKDVSTYIQSGNVIFRSGNSEAADMERLITQAIQKKYGFEAPVRIVDFEDLQIVFANNPFINNHSRDIPFLHVSFLSGIPDLEDLKKLDAKAFLPDEFFVNGNYIYLYCPNGYGRTKLTNSFFEKKLKLEATTRNWKTIIELMRISSQK